MPRYRIHRIKDLPRENFRWAPHLAGVAIVKPKDYDLDGEVEAASPYVLWKALLAQARPLRAGDLLEADDDSKQLHIAKYIGFQPAAWYVPEARAAAPIPAEVSEPAAAPATPIVSTEPEGGLS